MSQPEISRVLNSFREIIGYNTIFSIIPKDIFDKIEISSSRFTFENENIFFAFREVMMLRLKLMPHTLVDIKRLNFSETLDDLDENLSNFLLGSISRMNGAELSIAMKSCKMTYIFLKWLEKSMIMRSDADLNARRNVVANLPAPNYIVEPKHNVKIYLN